jgi:hypothetical protein
MSVSSRLNLRTHINAFNPSGITALHRAAERRAGKVVK